MAELICTVDEFHRFIGPSIRNKIQYMTKRKKQELKHVCQRCGKKKTELDSAYIRGMDRKKIINGVLSRYVINEDKQIIKIDVGRVEKEIPESHKPIDKYFKFLCTKCHTEYDAKK